MTLNRQLFRRAAVVVIASMSAHRPGRDQGTLNSAFFAGTNNSARPPAVGWFGTIARAAPNAGTSGDSKYRSLTLAIWRLFGVSG